MPGPIFGRILRAVEEMQLEGGLNSKEGAITWIEKNFLEKNDGT